MADVKVKIPSLSQRDVLEATRSGKRLIRIESVQKGARVFKSVRVVTPSGKAVEHTPIERKAVEACIERGWLQLRNTEDVASGTSSEYELSDTGRKAVKAKAPVST